MSLIDFGLKVSGYSRRAQIAMKQTTLFDFGLEVELHPDQTTLFDFQVGESLD